MMERNQSIPLFFSDIRTTSADLFDGLDWLHQNEIVHADLKTENMLLELAPELALSDAHDSEKIESFLAEFDDTLSPESSIDVDELQFKCLVPSRIQVQLRSQLEELRSQKRSAGPEVPRDAFAASVDGFRHALCGDYFRPARGARLKLCDYGAATHPELEYFLTSLDFGF